MKSFGFRVSGFEFVSPKSIISSAQSCIVICAMIVALSPSVEAQQPKNLPTIGWLSPGAASSEPSPSRLKSFRQGLAAHGYAEGNNIAIEYRYAEGKLDRLPELAAELVKLKVSVIVTYGNESIRAAKSKTRTIPIIMGFSADPVGDGFVRSLARPGGNITGLSSTSGQLVGKRLELLKEGVPSVQSVFALWHPSSLRVVSAQKEMEQATHALGLKLQLQEVRDANDLEHVFSSMGKARSSGIIFVAGAFMRNNLRRIVDLTTKSRLPAIADSGFADAGGLMAYGALRIDEFRRAAVYVDKILRGAKPTDLPVEQPTKFELVINLETAKQIGVTIPPNVLARADRVIR